MPFMELQTEYGTWFEVTNGQGESDWVPPGLVGNLCPEMGVEFDGEIYADRVLTIGREPGASKTAADHALQPREEILSEWHEWVRDLSQYVEVRIDEGDEAVVTVMAVLRWGARYSAPGYMDCTSWCVARTESEAREEAIANYGGDDACPQCGDETSDDDLCSECEKCQDCCDCHDPCEE